MNCRSIQAGFDERLDNRLNATQQQEFDTHIATCAKCRREWEAYAGAWQTLARHEAIEPSFSFVQRSLRRLNEPEVVTAPARWRLPVLRWALLATVVVAVGLGGWDGWRHYQGLKRAQIYASVQDATLLGDDFDVIASLDQLEGGNKL
jgi:predicted anti-sigma-YlaC factor YlaD